MKVMNAGLNNLGKWLHGIERTLNVSKTAPMIIGTNRKLHHSSSGELIQANFKISGGVIEQNAEILPSI